MGVRFFLGDGLHGFPLLSDESRGEVGFIEVSSSCMPSFSVPDKDSVEGLGCFFGVCLGVCGAVENGHKTVSRATSSSDSDDPCIPKAEYLVRGDSWQSNVSDGLFARVQGLILGWIGVVGPEVTSEDSRRRLGLTNFLVGLLISPSYSIFELPSKAEEFSSGRPG